MKTRFFATIALSLTRTLPAHAANSWVEANGKWETGTNWSLAVAPNSTQNVLITNSTTKTVTIDPTTSGSLPSTMTVNNLTLSGPGGTTNTLSLFDPGTNVPLKVLNNFTISSGGALSITNGALEVDGGGTSSFIINGSVLMSSGAMQAKAATIGGIGSSEGTLTIAGGTFTLTPSGQDTNLILRSVASERGTVWITGGQFTTTDAITLLGYSGVGQMTVSNGTWIAGAMYIGYNAGSKGTLTLAGGTITLVNQFYLGLTNNATGVVWITGGQLVATNVLSVGFLGGTGQMTISNGAMIARYVFVGTNPDSQGTLTVAGGTNRIYSSLTLGSSDCTATGILNVVGGELDVTNAAGNAVFEVRSGTLTISGGLLQADQFVVTNACAHFVRTGGTLLYGSAVLTTNLDADGDGIPNGYEQSHGLDPLNAADANLDSDGDGLSNLQEFLAGTDPTNSASAFRITSVVRTNTSILITWAMGSGKTNALERSAGGSGGSYSNNFSDIFTVTNTVGNSTNYLDLSAATNTPAQYYRVRLVP